MSNSMSLPPEVAIAVSHNDQGYSQPSMITAGAAGLKKFAFIAWIVFLLVTLSAVGYAIAKNWQAVKQFPQFIAGIPASAWVAIIFATLLFHAMDSLCLYSLLRILGFKLNASTGVKAIAVGRFASMLTPGKELHIPAEVFIIARQNVPPPLAVAAASTKTFFHLMWVCIFGALALHVSPNLPEGLLNSVGHNIWPPVLMIAFFGGIMLFAPKIHSGVQHYLSKSLHSHWKAMLLGGIEKSTGALAIISRSTHPAHLFAHIFAIMLVSAYCLTGYVLSRSLGIDISFAHALAIFSIALLIVYIVPVPGGIGVSEITTSYLITQSFSGPGFAAAILLRFLTNYIFLPLGAILLLGIVRKSGLSGLRQLEQRMSRPG